MFIAGLERLEAVIPFFVKRVRLANFRLAIPFAPFTQIEGEHIILKYVDIA